jgi:hypothetical protein
LLALIAEPLVPSAPRQQVVAATHADSRAAAPILRGCESEIKKFVRSLPVFGFGFPGRTTHSRELPRPDGPAGAHWDSTDLFSPLEAVCHATLSRSWRSSKAVRLSRIFGKFLMQSVRRPREKIARTAVSRDWDALLGLG